MGRITENAGQYQGQYERVAIELWCVLACSTTDCKTPDPVTIVYFHQSDSVEYISPKDTIFSTVIYCCRNLYFGDACYVLKTTLIIVVQHLYLFLMHNMRQCFIKGDRYEYLEEVGGVIDN
uniref:Uncharacterized protein n=1 Tax=Glossina austeni TaxID=7395 RepID=A0A1A9V4X2_GLOAU